MGILGLDSRAIIKYNNLIINEIHNLMIIIYL